MTQFRYKKYRLIGVVLVLLSFGLGACDRLEDELFEKNSYIVRNGWQDYELTVTEDNMAVLPIYFGVNGTSANDKDITVTMEVDRDTLDRYNWEKYKNQTSLYYTSNPQLSSSASFLRLNVLSSLN